MLPHWYPWNGRTSCSRLPARGLQRNIFEFFFVESAAAESIPVSPGFPVCESLTDLATPKEISAWLKAAAKGRGDTILYERHAWSTRAKAAGTVDVIPDDWRFTESRLKKLAERV